MGPLKRAIKIALASLNIKKYGTSKQGSRTPNTSRAHPIKGVFADIKRTLPDWTPTTIFDVGANVGQSALYYTRTFPNATIHSFEPVPAAFDALSKAVESHSNISTHFMALGEESGHVSMTANGVSTGNHIVAADVACQKDTITVPVSRGSAVFEKLQLKKISFLKIDAEGYDYKVLAGFAPVLSNVDFIQVEAGMNAYNETHVPYRLLEDFLREHGFLLFKFYDQAIEFKSGGRPVLRRANPVFINRDLVDLSGIR